MKTNSPAFPLRCFMLVCLLLLMAVPYLACAADALTYKGMWPDLPQPWYFSQPSGIAVDKAKNVYVADTNNSRVVKFSSAGVGTPWTTGGLYFPQGCRR